MRNLTRILISLPFVLMLVVLTPGLNNNSSADTHRSFLYNFIVPALLVIETGSGQGSGFYVSTDGYIITNEHVVKNSEEVTVINNNKERFKARVIAVERQRDLAILKALVNNAPILRLGDETSAGGGREVYVFGAPLRWPDSMSVGTVMNPAAQFQDMEYLQINAFAEPGSSGGPVVDSDGNVIGLTTIKVDTGSKQILLAIPIKDIILFLDKEAVGYSGIFKERYEMERERSESTGQHQYLNSALKWRLISFFAVILGLAGFYHMRARKMRKRAGLLGNDFKIDIHD